MNATEGSALSKQSELEALAFPLLAGCRTPCVVRRAPAANSERPSSREAPIVIVGGGCAGLSLAQSLIRQKVISAQKRLLVIEPRETYERDRTWCFWQAKDDQDSAAMTRHRWDRWAIAADGKRVEAGSDTLEYRMVPSDAFYRQAISEIDACPQAELIRGAKVTAVEDHGGEAMVTYEGSTSGRKTITASAVFDSRIDGRMFDPTKQRRSGVTLWQQFIGVEVSFDAPLADPGAATLMDFDAEQTALTGLPAAGFCYVLPTSPTTALVEATVFAAEHVPADVMERLVVEQVAQFSKGRGEVREQYREQGTLPMSTLALETAPSPRVRRIGLAGGFAKPSTGYAFAATQRFCGDLAYQMKRGGAVPTVPIRPWRTTFLDRVFLCRLDRVLRRDPSEIGPLFTRMFAETDPAAMVRFLSDTGSVLDDLRVIASMPKLPFMLEAMRSVSIWTQRRRPRRRKPVARRDAATPLPTKLLPAATS